MAVRLIQRCHFFISFFVEISKRLRNISKKNENKNHFGLSTAVVSIVATSTVEARLRNPAISQSISVDL